MKHFFRIDKEKEQIVLIEKNEKFEEKFEKPEFTTDIWFNLSNITNINGNHETRLIGDAIMDSYAFQIKNFGDKNYANQPKAHFQFSEAKEQINANHYYITNILNEEYEGISLFIDCYLNPAFLKEFSDRVSKKEVETLQVKLDISTKNNIFESLDMGGNRYLVMLKDTKNLANEKGEFGKIPSNINLENNLASGVKISWTRSYKLEVFGTDELNETE